MIDDSGPAFPIVGGTADYHHGMSMRQWIAAQAPASEIADMAPASTTTAAEFLGIPLAAYNPHVDWFRILARLRYQWADAMIAEQSASGRSNGQ